MTVKQLFLLGCGLYLAGLFAPAVTFPSVGDASLVESGSQLIVAAMLGFPAAAAAFAASDRPRLLIWFAAAMAVLAAYSFVRVHILIADLAAPSRFGGFAVSLAWGWIVIWAGAGIALFAAVRSLSSAAPVDTSPHVDGAGLHDSTATDHMPAAREPLMKAIAGLVIATAVIAIGWDIYKMTASRRTSEPTPASELPPVMGPYGSTTTNTASTVNAEPAATEEEAAYIRDHLRIYDVNARHFESVLDGRVPGVLFKIRNGGNRTLNRVEVRVVFHDAEGNAIAEEEYLPVLVSEYSYGGNNTPLRPNYIWQQESGRFYSAKSVPSEWVPGRVTATITDIEFAPQ